MINCEVVVASLLTDVTVDVIRDTAVLVTDVTEAILAVFITVFGKFGCVVDA